MTRASDQGDRPEVLLAIANLLQIEIDVDVLLRRIVDLITEAMGADRCTLFLVDRERSELYSKVADLPELEEIRLVIGQGIAGHVAATGEPVITGEARADDRFFGAIDASTGYETESILTVPVFARGRLSEPRSIAGVLQLLNKRGDASDQPLDPLNDHVNDHFNDEDCQLLTALADQVGEALTLTHLDDSRDRPARYNKIVGASDAMVPVYDRIASAASTSATVLILGESGTGKERVARAIHVNGDRADGPFITVDCTAIPDGLIEAELFGHEKGAFTGADRLVLGKCELAAGGTLFLDEIGEMPQPLQAKLLRFVQERELERVGGREVIKADVRVVAATNRDLAAEVEAGRFRRDLFYRIKVVEIAMPPLRDRGREDIALLARHFLRMYSRRHRTGVTKLAPATMATLVAYDWPGNIRELEHCIESAVVICNGDELLPIHLSLRPDATALTEWDEAAATDSVPSGLSLDELEKRYVLRTLAECNGNRTRAASILRIGRNTLLRKLKRYGVAP